jgi:hypothetical protein
MKDQQIADRLRSLVERRVSAEEVRRAVNEPLSGAEIEEILGLVRWFRRRYPSGVDRLTYVRQAYARWISR